MSVTNASGTTGNTIPAASPMDVVIDSFSQWGDTDAAVVVMCWCVIGGVPAVSAA
jgi:hypothetical protein